MPASPNMPVTGPNRAASLRTHRSRRWATCLMWLFPVLLHAGSWNTTLQDGQAISVDPVTHRATTAAGEGAGQPLWDGVHRLQDGSTITVRSGIMVPNEALVAPRTPPFPLAPGDLEANAPAQQRDPACDRLVVKTCGLRGECSRYEPCRLAGQLRELQNDAMQEASARSWAVQQCHQADADGRHFPACTYSASPASSPCQQLVEMLCIDRKRCGGSDACQMALQLQHLEWQTWHNEGPDISLGPTHQCQQMLVEHAFFAPCR